MQLPLMILLQESDYQALETFPLLWRWTDPRWNVLPSAILADIRVLTAAKTYAISERWGLFTRGRADTIPPFEFIDRLTELDVATRSDAQAQDWLQRQVVNLQQRVVVIWSPAIAVQTSLAVFQTYWSDFCYPASDDVAILPLTVDWLLTYSHEEVFRFGRRAAE